MELREIQDIEDQLKHALITKDVAKKLIDNILSKRGSGKRSRLSKVLVRGKAGTPAQSRRQSIVKEEEQQVPN